MVLLLLVSTIASSSFALARSGSEYTLLQDGIETEDADTDSPPPYMDTFSDEYPHPSITDHDELETPIEDAPSFQPRSALDTTDIISRSLRIGAGSFTAKGQLEGNKIHWTIEANRGSRTWWWPYYTLELKLSQGQTLKSVNKTDGPDLKGAFPHYWFYLNWRNQKASYQIETEIDPANGYRDYSLTLSTTIHGVKRTEQVVLRVPGSEDRSHDGDYEGHISSQTGFLAIKDKKSGKEEAAFCINTTKTFPELGNPADYKENEDKDISKLIKNKKLSNEEITKKIKQVIYYADANRNTLVGNKSLTSVEHGKDQFFYYLIQGVVWRYTDEDRDTEIFKKIGNPTEKESMKKTMDELQEKAKNVPAEDYERVNLRVFSPSKDQKFQNIISYTIKPIEKYPLKVNKKDKKGKKLAGASFAIYKATDGTGEKQNWKPNQDAQPVVSFETSSDIWNSEDIFLPGDYYMVETKAPTGFVKLDNSIPLTLDKTGQWKLGETIDGVSIEHDQNNKPVYTVSVENKPLYELRVNKKDKKGTKLAGASFAIYKEKDGTGQGRNWKPNSGAQPVSKFDTNSNIWSSGNIFLPGKYYMVETKAPTGFLKLDNSIPLVLNENGQWSLEETVDGVTIEHDQNKLVYTVQVENKPLYELILKKYDDAKKPLEKVTFKLFRASDGKLTNNNWLANKEAKPIYEGVTDSQGVWKTEKILRPGDYYLVETTPKDFVDNKPIKLELTEDGTWKEHSDTSEFLSDTKLGTYLKVTNIRLHHLELYKVDQKKNKITNNSATFEIFKKSDYTTGTDGKVEIKKNAQPVAKLTTDNKGYAKSEQVFTVGEYAIVETKNPIGFNKLPNPVKISLAYNDKGEAKWNIVEKNADSMISLEKNGSLAIKNTPTPFEYPKTGGSGTHAFYATGLMILIGLAAYILAEKRYKKDSK